MRIRTLRFPLSVLLAAAASVSCTHGSTNAMTPAPAPAASPSVASEASEAAAIAAARADSARIPYTAADVAFMSGMIAHHAQAIVMSGWAPSHGANATVRTLASRIINAQQDEIATLQQWLRDRQQPVPAPDPKGMMMSMGGMQHEMLMPGMLTEAQMQQLDAARNEEFDRLFLTFMIQHHEGAVSMVKDLFASYGAGQQQSVFKIASDINVDQTTEIARMQKMLGDLVFGKP